MILNRNIRKPTKCRKKKNRRNSISVCVKRKLEMRSRHLKDEQLRTENEQEKEAKTRPRMNTGGEKSDAYNIILSYYPSLQYRIKYVSEYFT